MVEKEGTDGEKDAMRAYKAARKEGNKSDDVGESNQVSLALIDKVSLDTRQVAS